MDDLSEKELHRTLEAAIRRLTESHQRVYEGRIGIQRFFWSSKGRDMRGWTFIFLRSGAPQLGQVKYIAYHVSWEILNAYGLSNIPAAERVAFCILVSIYLCLACYPYNHMPVCMLETFLGYPLENQEGETFQAIKLAMNAVRENNGEFRDMIFRDLFEGLPEMQAHNSFMPLEDLRQELDKIDLVQVGNYFASYLPRPEELIKG